MPQNNCICYVLNSRIKLLLCKYWCITAGCGGAVAFQNADTVMEEMPQSDKALGENR